VRTPDTLVLLAGGEARRLPHKLELEIDGEPMIVRAVRRFSQNFCVVVSLANPLPNAIVRKMDCAFVFDRWGKRGPLGGMISACQSLAGEWLGFLAADLPFVDSALMIALREARCPGDDAVLASHDGHVEPLVGWYNRRALLREAEAALARDEAAVYRVIDRLRARFVAVPGENFANINTAEDLEAMRHTQTPR
jgi:molybdopterin-guanine dinucleotide biosynthesis protein A